MTSWKDVNQSLEEELYTQTWLLEAFSTAAGPLVECAANTSVIKHIEMELLSFSVLARRPCAALRLS